MLGIPSTSSVSLIVAKSNSGKSHLIRYILTQWAIKKEFDYCFVFANTKFNHGYDYIEDGFVYGGMTSDELEGVIKKIVRKQLEVEKVRGKKPKAVLVFDDCMSYNFDSPFWRRIITEYRHYGLTLIFSVQYLVKAVPTIFREQATHVIIFRTENYNSIDALHKAFMLDISRKEIYDFINIFP